MYDPCRSGEAVKSELDFLSCGLLHWISNLNYSSISLNICSNPTYAALKRQIMTDFVISSSPLLLSPLVLTQVLNQLVSLYIAT